MAAESVSLATDPVESEDARRQRGREALRNEAGQAFKYGSSLRRRRSRQRRRGSSDRDDITWLSLQCPGGLESARIAVGTKEGVCELFPLYSGDRSKLKCLEKQTFHMWKSVMEFERVCHPIRQRRKTILIQPITYLHGNRSGHHGKRSGRRGGRSGNVSGEEVARDNEVFYRHTHIDGKVLDLLQEFCSAYFPEMRVKLAPPLDLSEIPKLTSRVHRWTNRRQFLVDDIINFLSSRKLKKAYCILGVTMVDLYPGPEWNFVLGQACKEKGSGVFSFGRYFHSTVTKGEMRLGEEEAEGCGKEGKEGRGKEGKEGRDKEEEEGCDRGRDESGSGVQGKEMEEEQTRNLWILMRVSRDL